MGKPGAARRVSIETPCIRICTLDDTGQWCLGCYRTLDEIAMWASLSPPQRAAVLEELPARRARFEETGS